MLQDIRLSFRRLRRQPAFAVAAVLTLALGVGANTAIFNLLNAVLLRPLPYAEPDRLALLWEVFPESAFAQIPSGEINLQVWKEEFQTVQSLASFKLTNRSITGPGDPRQVVCWKVSANLFETLGVPVLVGQDFGKGDDRLGAAPKMILSHQIWADQFGSDPGVVKRSVWLDGVAYTVSGILPEGVFFPPPLRILGGTHELAGQVFVPEIVDPEAPDPRRNMALLVRLAAGQSREAAEREVRVRAERLAATFPEYNPADLSATLVPLHEQAVSDARQGLIVMFLAVSLVLLVACLNVANLLIARGAGQRSEIAIRGALGATRARLMRMQMTESLLLAFLGGIAGTGLAGLFTPLLLALTRSQIPQLGTVGFSTRVFAFAWGISLLACLLFGLVPALRLSRSGVRPRLRPTRGSASTIHPGLHSTLVVSEVALATVLLVVTGLLTQSFWRLQQVRLGFDSSDVLTLNFLTPEGRYPEARHVQQLMREIQQSIQASALIREVGAISGLPLSGDREGAPIEIRGRPTETLEERLNSMAGLRFVTPGYFSTLRIPFLSGRDFGWNDRAGAPNVAIVDRSFVNRFFPEGRALGSRIAFEDDQDSQVQWREIVGVVDDVRQESLHREPQFVGMVYIPHAQIPNGAMSLVVRSQLPVETVTSEVIERIRLVEPQLALNVEPLQSLVDRALAPHRSPALLLAVLAILAVILAMVGLYGVIAFVVQRRTCEIGVRIALGAPPRSIFGLVLSQTSRWTLAGILIGLGLSYACNRILSGLLFEVPAVDVLTYGAAAVLFSLIALLAAFFPARTALRIDPCQALRDR